MLNDPRHTRAVTAQVTALPAVLLPGDRAPRRHTILRRALRIFLFALLVLAAALAVAAALVVSGPIEIGLLRGRIDSAIDSVLGANYDAAVGAASIDVDPVLGLVVRISDISVRDGAGEVVATVPSTMLAVNLLALLTAETVVRSIEIDDLHVSVVRDGGRVFLGTPETPAAEGVAEGAERSGAAALAEALLAPGGGDGAPVGEGFQMLAGPAEALERGLDQVMDFATRSGFRRIAAYNADIELWHVGGEDPQQFRRAELRMDVEPATGQMTAALSTSGYSGRWTTTAERTVNPLTGGRSISVTFSQLTLADILPALVGGDAGIRTDIPLYGLANARFDAEGRIEDASLRLDLGAGHIAFGSDADSLLLDEATIRLRWDVEGEVIAVDSSPFYFGPSQAVVSGTIRPEGLTGRRFAFDLGARDAILAPRDSPAPPLRVEEMRATGTADLDSGLLEFDSAAIRTASGSLIAAGSIGLEPGGPSLALAASLTTMPVSVLQQIWPPGLADGARRWVLRSVTDGTIVSGRLETAIPSGVLLRGVPAVFSPEMLHFQLEVEDVDFQTMEGFPSVEDASGVAVLSGSTFGVDIESGRIVTSSGEVVELTAGAFAVPDTSTEVDVARLEVRGFGSAAAFAEIADSDPINAMETYGITPGEIEGEANARLSARWQLSEGVTFEEVDWEVDLDLTDLAAAEPVEGHTFADADVNLNLTPSLITVTGRAIVDGLPADVDLAFPLLGELAGGRQQLRVVLDEEARQRLGFNLEGFLGGTLLASMSDLPEGEAGQRYQLDLGQARVVLGPLGWTKGIGVPATMSFDLVETPEGYWVRDLVLEGDGFGFSGEARLDHDYGILSATINDLHLRQADALDVTLERDGNGWAIDAVGESFDVRGFIAQLGESVESTGGTTDISVTGRVQSLIGFNNQTIEDARIVFDLRDGSIRRAEMSGSIGGDMISGLYVDPDDGEAVLDVSVGDAGALMRFVDLYTRADGGQLRIVGQETVEDTLEGQFDMVGFTLIGEEALGALTSSDSQAVAATGIVPVDNLSFTFVQRGPLIVVEDGLLRGGEMGATWSGTLDMVEGSVAITGTYIPAYTVNNLFGRIPLLGLALGGGQEGALFGVTFRVAGPLDQVQLEVNPLSAIAPGILRKIFEFQ